MRMIEVNVLNTISTIAQAREKGAKKYFCVSTDKAANPANPANPANGTVSGHPDMLVRTKSAPETSES